MISASDLEVEGEAHGEELVLLGSNDGLERHAGHEGRGDLVVDLVLEHGVEVAVLVDLELAAGLAIELVRHTELGLDGLGGPVEGELAADGLGGGGGVVHVEEELAELEGFLVHGLVLEAEVGLIGEDPVEAEVVLLEVGGVGVEVELAADGEVRAPAVGPGVLDEVAAEVEEDLVAELVGDVLKPGLEVGLVGRASGLGVDVADELEALGGVELLQRCQSSESHLPRRRT